MLGFSDFSSSDKSSRTISVRGIRFSTSHGSFCSVVNGVRFFPSNCKTRGIQSVNTPGKHPSLTNWRKGRSVFVVILLGISTEKTTKCYLVTQNVNAETSRKEPLHRPLFYNYSAAADVLSFKTDAKSIPVKDQRKRFWKTILKFSPMGLPMVCSRETIVLSSEKCIRHLRNVR